MVDEETHEKLVKLEDRIQELEAQVVSQLQMVKQYNAPIRFHEGMLIYADGTNWDPGTGIGLYQYRGGSWVFIG